MSFSFLYDPDETIAAIATAPGEGGIAIIRISGKNAFPLANRIFSGPVLTYPSHTVHFGKIKNLQKEPIDDVLLLVMKGPKSFTGEDTVEIHCHGGSLVAKKILQLVIEIGARPARPGEFTFRSFCNKKIDLSQAEAIQGIISAKNEHALKSAENQLQGALSKKIQEFQKEMVGLAAILEAWVDFPEEGLEFMSMEEFKNSLEHLLKKMQNLENTFYEGKVIHDGINLSLIGSPNVGKSSLMNALLGKERAIVSEIPGTTRDFVEDHLFLNGLHFRITDTAGIREATETIEKEGIKRSKEIMENSDLILFVMDAAKEITDDEQKLLEKLPKEKTIVIWNKIDISKKSPPFLEKIPIVSLSAKEEKGLDDLKKAMDEVIWKKGPPEKEEVVLTSLRHKNALTKAIQKAFVVLEGLETQVSPEFLAYDLRNSLEFLKEIIGQDVTEEVLSSIFSQFCIGK